MVTVDKRKEHVNPLPDNSVTVKRMGNITEIRDMSRNTGGIIRKLSKDEYCDTRTGEVFEYTHIETRIDNPENVARTLRNLRDIINANITDVKKCLWSTLTYAENMTDTKRLYNDFRKFIMRFQYYLTQNNLSKFEYIAAAEPQERGAWHLHGLLLFPTKAPFIPNAELARLWGHGFVKITSLKNVDNVGVYLTAYLGDMDFMEAFGTIDLNNAKIKEVTTTDKHNNKQKKAIVKGARLKLYPTGFRIYRCSRGIKKPVIYECTEAEAMQRVKGQTLTFEKTIQLSEDGEIFNVIHYRHYNRKPNKKKGVSREE